MRTIRLYLGDLDSDFVEAKITESEFEKMKEEKRINVDDGGIWFVELILTYHRD